MRGERLGISGGNLYIYSEVILEKILDQVEVLCPDLIVIDSIQSVFSTKMDAPPGSVSQIRYCAGMCMEIAKGKNVPVFVIGHVTKDGWIAGPKMLEHLVDTVLYFEGDSSGAFRLLRTVKNRFGPTGEIGVFEMREEGLTEIKDPSGIFIHGLGEGLPGSAAMATIEGTRAFVVEVQSLVNKTTFPMPRRVSIGIDQSRISVLLAVMGRRARLSFSNADVVVNVAGGIKVTEPAADLAVVMAIASSSLDRPLPKGMVLVGEVGLNGEIRAVNRMETRISEARKMGFSSIAIPEANMHSLSKSHTKGQMKLIPIAHMQDAFRLLGTKKSEIFDDKG
jgi:DNA repair protein RadA/Sms